MTQCYFGEWTEHTQKKKHKNSNKMKILFEFDRD
jgi:hypothetical protein